MLGGKRTVIRSPSEYPLLISFAKGCLTATIVLATLLILLSSVHFMCNAMIVYYKSTLVVFWLFLCASIFTIRSFTMAFQCKSGLSQTFGRPCPEYITVATLLLILLTSVWPVPEKTKAYMNTRPAAGDASRGAKVPER